MPDLWDRFEALAGKMIRRKPPLRKVGLRAKSLGLRRSKGRTNYKERLWKVFSEFIRRREADPHTGLVACVTCGKQDHWKNMDAGHYHARTTGLALYFHEANVWPQCTGCNRFRHGNIPAFSLFLQNRFGPGILPELDEIRRTFRKISETDYLELIAEYQKKLEALP
jgi:hypothetical protein